MNPLHLLFYYVVGCLIAFATLTVAGLWEKDRSTLWAMTFSWFFWCLPMAVALIGLWLWKIVEWLAEKRNA